MFIRALQTCSVNSVKGPIYLNGPDFVDDGQGGSSQAKPGEVAQVADDYAVNPDVHEVVVPVPNTKPQEYERAKVQPADKGAKDPKGKQQTAGTAT